jgi:cobalt-zinc-cadmium efflux system membrane fusion protein
MSTSTVLLVDDDEVLRQVLRRVLAQQGHRVVEAHDVAGALEAARATPPQLALLDLRLPDGDGVELARKLEEQGGRFPLILMTAYPLRLREHPEAARDFARVLTKPLDLRELRQAVDAALAAPPRPAPPPAPQPAPAAPAAAAAARGAAMPNEPAPPPPTPPGTPALGRRPSWLGIAAALAGAAALLAALWWGGPVVKGWLKREGPNTELNVNDEPDAVAKPVAGDPGGIELPPDSARQMGIAAEPVERVRATRPLVLSGTLNYDADRLASLRSRFAGEVMQVEKVAEPGPNGPTQERVLSLGDRVDRGQLLAVVWSRDQGQQKSALVDALVKLWLDEKVLAGYERASSSLSEVALVVQRNQVAADRSAVRTAERTLRVSRVPEGEIEEVRQEARRIFELKDIPQKDRERADKEKEWARVEIRSPIAGTVVEKNVNVGAIVDTSTDLFKVADLGKLTVWANAYEENLAALQQMPRPIPWEVRITSGRGDELLKSDGIEKIAPSIDPNQHTALLVGRVDNTGERLKVGSFVTATVQLAPPPDTVAVPTTALCDNGDETVLFVQPEAGRTVYSARRVKVVRRFVQSAYVRSRLSEAEKKQGFQEVHPGDLVVTHGVLELFGQLGEIRAKEKATQAAEGEKANGQK